MKFKGILFKRKIFLILILIIAVGAIGVCYGYWTDELYIGSRISTAQLNLDFVDNLNNSVDLCVTSGSAIQCINFEIKNNGNIGAKLLNEKITINGENDVANICTISFDNLNKDIYSVGSVIEGQIIIDIDTLKSSMNNTIQYDSSIVDTTQELVNPNYKIDIELLFTQFNNQSFKYTGWMKSLGMTINICEENDNVVE